MCRGHEYLETQESAFIVVQPGLLIPTAGAVPDKRPENVIHYFILRAREQADF